MILSMQTSNLVARFGLEDGIKLLCEGGFDAIDYSFFSTPIHTYENSREVAENIKKLAAGYGVSFNQAHAPFGGGYDNYVNNLIPTFPKAFETAALLGVRQMVVHPLQKGRYYGHEKELFDLNMKFYESIKPLAANYGIKIAIENMWQTNPFGGYIIEDVCANPAELAAYYDTLDDPDNFTVCLDIGHVALCNREPEDAIRILGHDRLGALHVHDVDYKSDLHTLPGIGRINWNNVTKALKDISYKGEFTYEADDFYSRYDREFMPEAIAFSEKLGRYLIKMIEQ